MSPKKFKHFLTLQLVLCLIYAQSDDKSSLTFVIDDTGSMSNDITEVIQGANAIFDTVMNSNESQIENFILVTFNDPGTQLRAKTKDRSEFKTALSSISVNGGGDCPELAMSGIELGLKESLPNSYLYVFTDASAKDYTQVDRIKSLSQKQQSQIVFVLTGMCSGESDPQYKVYGTLATATSGQVFHLQKSEVGKILEYVKETVKGRKTVIADEKFSPGYGHKFNYTVDSKMKDVVVAVSGTDPKVNVTGPDGSKPSTTDIMRTSKIAVVKIETTKPGIHTAEVGSKTDTTAVVTGTTTINFQHGFSTIKPTSIKETATRPLPDEQSYLSIQLISKGDDIELTTAEIINMDGIVIFEKPLILLDDKTKFYVTEPLLPPNVMFKVAIKGLDKASKTPIRRISPTAIEPQKTFDKPTNKAPIAKIEGEFKINVEYDEPLQLKCKINGYPKPKIEWIEEDTGHIIPSNVSTLELPYDYISVLDIEKVKKNGTYRCKARNDYGEDNKEVEVETIRKTYFIVVERPRDTFIEYQTSKKIVCKIDALPPAKITWYRNGKELHKNDNIDISTDGSILTIQDMQVKTAGFFLCEARNEFNRSVFAFDVKISGVAAPKIDKSTDDIHVARGSEANITCRIIQGKPKPTIHWFFESNLEEKMNFQPQYTEEVIHINNASSEHAGSYRCIAQNIIGRDVYDTDFVVEYPPSIKQDGTLIRAKDGESITLKCSVDGIPIPTVRWIVNDRVIRNERKRRIYRDYNLNFEATVRDSGNYTCQATNKYGTATKIVKVEVFVPVRIESPKLSTMEVTVGSHVALPCRADGYPKPDIQWIYYNMDPKIPPKTTTPNDSAGSKVLPRIQVDEEGFYSCVASNVHSSANITYFVKVNAPPQIINVYPEKTYMAVNGDLILKIPCKAIGNPKPTITWLKGGLSLASGSIWYDIEEDGTLIIKNVDKDAAGSYVCEAKNSLGFDNEIYDVVVRPYPESSPPTSTVLLRKGQSSSIKCDVPHDKIDKLLWYKNGRVVSSGELTLNNVTVSDSGVYTCRVSTFSGARSGNTQVMVGFKPKFLSDENTYIDFVEGASALLICNAEGEPKPQVAWWHDGKKLDVTDEIYYFDMTPSDQGHYFCVVKNTFGDINRRFEIAPRECLVNMTTLEEKQPVILSEYLEWLTFENNRGYMHIPAGENIKLFCPGGFSDIPRVDIEAACDRGTDFLNPDEGVLKYEELKCREEIKPAFKRTGYPCLFGNTETVEIGYEVNAQFFEVYRVCLDKNNRIPLYAKQSIDSTLADFIPNNEVKWFNNDLLPFDFDTLYECGHQTEGISRLLSKKFHGEDRCCFSKRQLINPRDVPLGLPQKATFSNLNVVPHWSTCNEKNWEDVEKRVRDLAKSASHKLLVWTGTSQQLQLPTYPSMTNVYIDDGTNRQPVPRFLWKVVQDPATKASLAIVQVNSPDLPLAEAYRHVLCRDICNEVTWMKSSMWRDVTRGYTYCCRIEEFERAFGYHRRLFDRGEGKVLYDVSFLPSSHSLTK